MPNRRFLLMASAMVATLCLTAPFANPAAYSQNNTTQTAPDNSANNKDAGRTADNQSNGRSDVQTTAAARRAIIADKDLSTYAHNVKIITSRGTVTLKGPVKSEEEKQKVASDVANVVSADKINNELTVKQ
jgi:hyperosmotically inducible protein